MLCLLPDIPAAAEIKVLLSVEFTPEFSEEAFTLKSLLRQAMLWFACLSLIHISEPTRPP